MKLLLLILKILFRRKFIPVGKIIVTMVQCLTCKRRRPERGWRMCMGQRITGLKLI